MTAELRRKYEKRHEHHHAHHHNRPHSDQTEQQQIRKTRRAVSENTGLRHEDLKLNGELKADADVDDEGVLMRRRRRLSSDSNSTENGQDLEPPIVPVLRTTTAQPAVPQNNHHHYIKNEQLGQGQKQVDPKKEESVIGAAIERKTPLTRDDIQKMNLKKKTRKRTRKFEIDGVVVTTTTSKVIYGDDENQRFYDEHYFRKQELRELKQLQKQEQKQFQDLVSWNYYFF